MFCIIGAYKAASASVIAPMQYSQILWAGFFGFLLFGDQISLSFVAGAGLIVLSGLYIVKREWNQGRSLKPVIGNGTFRPDISSQRDIYYFEHRVPKDISIHYSASKIIKSLRTKNITTATLVSAQYAKQLLTSLSEITRHPSKT